MLFATLRDRIYPMFYLCLLCESHGLVVSTRSFVGFFWLSSVQLGSARPRLGGFCLPLMPLMLLTRLAPSEGLWTFLCPLVALCFDATLLGTVATSSVMYAVPLGYLSLGMVLWIRWAVPHS